jgi:putative thiamine transport system ATP-binding protein
MLQLNDLSISLNAAPMVRLSVQVRAGEVLTIMGPSGSGKSTLLAALIGALPPVFTQGGTIVLDGQDITVLPTAQRRIGILFQDDVLFPHLSVAGNLAFAVPRAQGETRQSRQAAIDAALASVGLAGMGKRDPGGLSGGQRSRVALLRALLAQPKALLLDEAFSRLDTDLRQQIRALVFEKARDIPVIMVTHDGDDARAAGGPVMSPLGQTISL